MMVQKQHLLFFVSILFVALDVNGQTVSSKTLAVSGNFTHSGGYSLSHMVGEMTSIKTVVSSEYILTQGFHQPEPKKTAQIAGFSSISGALDLFPNPANDFVHLQYELPFSGEMQMTVYNSLGQQVSANYADQYNTGKKTFTIYTADLAAGVYYVETLFTAINGKQYSFNKKLEVIR